MTTCHYRYQTKEKSRGISPETDPELDMSSMIDVSFLLLIYFIVTSTLDPKEADLGLTLPGRPGISDLPMEMDPLPIQINHQGHVSILHEVLDTDPHNRELPKLLDRLVTYVSSAKLTNSPPLVTIETDDATKNQRFVDVLNALAQVQIEKITLVGFRDD
jgi:biopolymer transport protein ExbD